MSKRKEPVRKCFRQAPEFQRFRFIRSEDRFYAARHLCFFVSHRLGKPMNSESFCTLPLALAFRTAASESFMLVSSKTVQKCAAKTGKIYLHQFEFKEDFCRAGISPCRNGIVVLVPANLPTIFGGVHVGTWFLLDKERRPKSHFSL